MSDDTASQTVADHGQAIVTPRSEHRFKILRLSRNLFVDVFNWWKNPPNWLALPVTEDLPEDCEVLDIQYNWECDCFEAKIVSKEFSMVQPGAMIERIPGMLTQMRTVDLGKSA